MIRSHAAGPLASCGIIPLTGQEALLVERVREMVEHGFGRVVVVVVDHRVDRIETSKSEKF